MIIIKYLDEPACTYPILLAVGFIVVAGSPGICAMVDHGLVGTKGTSLKIIDQMCRSSGHCE
jgi:hypothetical protein